MGKVGRLRDWRQKAWLLWHYNGAVVQAHMAQEPMLRVEVGARFVCVQRTPVGRGVCVCGGWHMQASARGVGAHVRARL